MLEILSVHDSAPSGVNVGAAGACSQPRLTDKRSTSRPEGIVSLSCGVVHSLKSWDARPLISPHCLERQRVEAVSLRIACAPPQTNDAPKTWRSPHDAHPAKLTQPSGASAQLLAPLPTPWQGRLPHACRGARKSSVKSSADRTENRVCCNWPSVARENSSHDVGCCIRKFPFVHAALIFCRVSLGAPPRR